VLILPFLCILAAVDATDAWDSAARTPHNTTAIRYAGYQSFTGNNFTQPFFAFPVTSTNPQGEPATPTERIKDL
jgi:hypothetical protein